MDPVSQAVLGASIPQAVSRKAQVATATLCGALAGMAPDLDALIRSSTDPLMYLEFHRQFTHSLIFIPAGAVLCALLLHGFLRKWLSFRETILACLLGYATHALLDACTDEMVDAIALAGPPDELRERLRELGRIADSFTLAVPFYGLSPEKTLMYNERIAETFY